MTTATLTPEEIEALSGGYKRPTSQLMALRRAGYARAMLSPKTGRVILERAHAEAVARGEFNPPAAVKAEKRPAVR